jgi:hypothetical protein
MKAAHACAPDPRPVHVTSSAWGLTIASARACLDLVAQGKINAVELDVKEEGGIVGWNAPVPLAHEIDAVQPRYDLADAGAHACHAKGVRVIGRLVCFNDPIYAAYAWTHGRRDEVVQTPGGGKYGGYGGFTNFSNPVVRRYQIDIAAAGGQGGRGRDPLRLRPPSRRPALVHGLSRTEGRA